MRQTWMRTMLLLSFACCLLAQSAAATEGKKTARHEATYRQVTGEVVSVGQDKIEIKNRTKGTMTVAITKTTDMIGQPVKKGDKATVRYRIDENGNTATRISAANAAAKSAAKRTVAASSRAAH